ncbi:hypothetical protein [Ancylobacter pratisalsi]|uniref:Uncharacterized protein n=1 Tax=Ancylobacter pratisalsi TaxID=1745854 RepID=A0A6P1YGI6_9HYPH|nr:hypothetical protein [Ancylobacter pratisalsi]QIB32262.1 hypothetical protein G3A50_16635 [Ancylobacter pratisalsi]
MGNLPSGGRRRVEATRGNGGMQMGRAGFRRYRDKLLFALAYGAIIVAIVYAHPFAGERAAPVVAAAMTPAP